MAQGARRRSGQNLAAARAYYALHGGTLTAPRGATSFDIQIGQYLTNIYRPADSVRPGPLVPDRFPDLVAAAVESSRRCWSWMVSCWSGIRERAGCRSRRCGAE